MKAGDPKNRSRATYIALRNDMQHNVRASSPWSSRLVAYCLCSGWDRSVYVRCDGDLL